MAGKVGTLAIHDPPYNLVAFDRRTDAAYSEWWESWVRLTERHLIQNAALYVWLGADQARHFQPLPRFMMMMEPLGLFESRSFITMRNPRGYGPTPWKSTTEMVCNPPGERVGCSERYDSKL